MAHPGRVRCTHDLTVESKRALESLKLEARRRGFGAISETQILELLIDAASPETIAKLIRRRDAQIAAHNRDVLEELARQPRKK